MKVPALILQATKPACYTIGTTLERRKVPIVDTTQIENKPKGTIISLMDESKEGFFEVPDAPSKKMVSSLRATHHEMLRMHVMGISIREIASELGISIPAVSNVISSPLGQARIEELHAAKDDKAVQASEVIANAQVAAAEKLVEMLEPEAQGVSAALAAKVASDLLDRGGHGKVTKTVLENNGLIGKIGLNVILERASQAGVIDITPSVPLLENADG